jgi:hypothetical protein
MIQKLEIPPVLPCSLHEWIDVRDRLPEPKWPETIVIMCNGNGFVTVGYHQDDEDWRHENHAPAGNVIAWRLMPDRVTLAELDASRSQENEIGEARRENTPPQQ